MIIRIPQIKQVFYLFLKSGDNYSMDNKKRGIALIINNSELEKV
jgi:hypothetical protein